MKRFAGMFLGLALMLAGAAMSWRAAEDYLQPSGSHATWGEIHALWGGYDSAERLTDALQD